MKSPIKELSPQPLIDPWHINGRSQGRDSSSRSTSSSIEFLEISAVLKHGEARTNDHHQHDIGIDDHLKINRQLTKKKKNVSFSPAVITIHFPRNEQSGETVKSVSSGLWYSASDFLRFRAESYETAAKASGDVDYQHFFLNFVYSKATTIAKEANNGVSECSVSVTYAPFTGPLANPKLRDLLSICIDTFGDLCLLGKYRGLERIIFRNLVQPSKLSYIEACIRHHQKVARTDLLMGSSLNVEHSFRHHTIASQLVSQFLGQIDDITAQDLIRKELQSEHQLSFLSSQQVHLSFPALASLHILQRTAIDKKRALHRRRCFMEL